MMLVPRKKSYDIFDSFFDEPFFEGGKRREHHDMMRTDIKEKDGNYILEMDVPGCNKENIKIELDNGYITISAKTNDNVDEEKEGYIYKERFVGECSRSFYVGDNIKEEDIKASFKNGTLILTFPKENVKQIENKKTIEIE